MKYQILERDKSKYISLILLNEIINFQHYFPTKLEGEDVFLEPYLTSLLQNGGLEIKNKKYVPTEKGREELVNLYEKYFEYLKLFDIFCAVDLEAGEFAFSSIEDFQTDEEWFDFLNNPRFSDVRVAVADFKGLNPTEIVFMSFLNENRFDCTIEKWQYNLTGDAVWTEIEEICNTAIDVDYLKQDGVLEDVIKQGTEIALNLLKLAEDSKRIYEDVDEEIVTEEIEEYVEVVEEPYHPYSYYEVYYDPFYISPIWFAAPLVILF